MNSEKYIGLDVHQASIVVAVMDSTGKLVMESILETKAATILQFFAGLRGTLSVTFEESAAVLSVTQQAATINTIATEESKNRIGVFNITGSRE